jgi:hypothetical protein
LQIVETAAPSSWRPGVADAIEPLPPRLLAAIAIDHASSADFEALAEPLPGERTSTRVYLGETHDIWLIRWGARSGTVMHDHGGSAGALYVVRGDLVERRPNPAGAGRHTRRQLRTSDHRAMPATHVHEVVNESDTPAATIHAYSPPLVTMRHYDDGDDGSGPPMMRREVVDVDTFTLHGPAAHR